MTIVSLRNEYTIHDKEAAYEVYKDPKQGGRSLRRTARITEIPFATLQYWNRTLNWQQRIWAEDERDAAIIEQTTKLRLVNELDGLMDNLIWLAYNGKPEDKVKADMTKHALSMVGMSAIQKVQQDITQSVSVTKPAGETEERLTAKTSDDLAKLVNEKIKALMSGGSSESEKSGDTEQSEVPPKAGDEEEN